MNKSILFKTIIIAFVLSVFAYTEVFAQATLPINATFSTVTTSGAGTMPTGFTQSGLTGYAGALKFASTDVWLQLYFNTNPGTLNFDLGVNNTFPGSIPTTATFTLQESANGTSWTPVVTYTNIAGGTKTITTLNAASRYIRWYYTTKPSGTNIALKNITLTVGAPLCSSANLTFATSAFNKIISDAAFTQLATSLNTLTPITYSSNATGVATVNATTGEVNIVGAGTATITANQAAGTFNSVDYCASTATYTIYIGAALPTISITEVTAPVLTTDVGTTESQTINIGGLYLNDNIQLSISGTSSDQFSVSPNLVNQISGVAANTLITINYSPTAAGIHSATLNLISNGAASGTISLNGTSTIATTEIHSTPIENLVAGNGKLRLSANSGETIEVFTVVGQKLFQQTAIEGINTIQISQHGVLLVKAGNRISKVIL